MSLGICLMEISLKPDLLFFAGFQIKRFDLVSVADFHLAIEVRMDHCSNESTVLPFLVDGEASPSSQSSDVSRWPGVRESWQKMDLIVNALKKHLHDPGRTSESPVDLERRMGIE
jgi:hypothetical protein